jgi:fatty acid/phospholipid biosynthesis enzyme
MLKQQQTVATQNIRAPRSLAGAQSQDIQAPRSQELQAPRSQDTQAPRSQGVQTARSAELTKAATLVREADAACKAGNTAMASEKAKAAMELMKK